MFYSTTRNKMKLIIFALMIAIFARSVSGNMYIVEAGKDGMRGPMLTDDFAFCADKFSSRGFSVMCEIPANVASVTFFVNGQALRKESIVPFTINGRDSLTRTIFPWNEYPLGDVLLECRYSNMVTESVRGSFSCDTDTAETSQYYTTTPLPSTCSSPTPSPSNTNIKPYRECISIPADEYVNEIKPGGWEQTIDGVAFRLETAVNRSSGPGRFLLEYEFEATSTGHFGISLDMTTSNWQAHNSVWVRFSNGIRLRRQGTVDDVSGRRFIRAYHNNAGRSQISFATLHDSDVAHSMSTSIVLHKGHKYTIYISGRSSKVTVHSILLLPCEGKQCKAGTVQWQKMLRTCNSL